jgi:hypothetical protein
MLTAFGRQVKKKFNLRPYNTLSEKQTFKMRLHYQLLVSLTPIISDLSTVWSQISLLRCTLQGCPGLLAKIEQVNRGGSYVELDYPV